ncbi:hypothetical protein FSARC_13323 [Fusarium sarcochroum]|uniref:Protein kinase domain-containing protein n=1 Tax=Fusarium sarcochroum TaxID=1208366 RepID=A0A8H4T279_9HYPO|nr:hypothetical protein FSARC_13323 [Fusarium sarcochroum]
MVLLQAKKIFTILVLVDEAWAIANLIRQDNISDVDLPLSRKGSIGNDDYNVLVSVKTGKEFPSFATWPKEASVKAFLKEQWVVQAPVLDCFGKHISLDSKCPLALIESFTEAKRGGSGLVHKCRVHAAHQTIFELNTEPYIAIKEVNIEQTFEKERENLRLIQGLDHKHLIKLIATCQKGQIFYFMFPWANGGDLRDFWKRNDPRPRTPALFLWSLRQMLGIVSAIKALHGKNIRHGDIKPQNILHFLEGRGENNDEEGVLVIADVGISRLHREITSMRNAPTNSNESTISYEAPEAQSDQREGKPRPRRYDMWSLGCMFLEFTVWLVHDYNAVRSFRWCRISRDEPTTTPGNFFTRKSESSVQIHSAVNDAIKHLRSNQLCKGDTALGDLIQLIEEDLLQTEALKRAEAPELFDRLEKIVSAAEDTPGYMGRQTDPPSAIPEFFNRSGPRHNSASGARRPSLRVD